MQAVARSLVPQMAQEVAGVKSEVAAVVAGFRGAFSAAAARLTQRSAALAQADARLASLGPEGLEGLVRQLEEVQGRVAQAEAVRAQLAQELALSEGQRCVQLSYGYITVCGYLMLFFGSGCVAVHHACGVDGDEANLLGDCVCFSTGSRVCTRSLES